MAYTEVFKRKEIKYLLDSDQYEALMRWMKGYAEIDAYGDTEILNIYFDTPDFMLIRTSLDKPIYKEKLRLRTYGTPEDGTNAFIEIKKKYKGIVYKRRIMVPYKNAVEYLIKGNELQTKDSNRQIAAEIEAFRAHYKTLQPKMMVSYKRIALAGIEEPELRLTIDRDISWRTDRLDLKDGGEGRKILKDGQYLMEIKVGNSMPLKLSRILSELGIFPVSISKYGKGYADMISLQAARIISEEIIVNEEMMRKRGVAYA